MPEIKMTLMTFIQYVPVLISALLYSLGGRDDLFWWTKKAIRRYLAPFVALCFGLFTWNLSDSGVNCWLYYGAFTLSYTIFVFGLSLGYSADSKLASFFKRLLCGAVIGLALVPFIFTGGSFSVAVFHLCACIFGSTFFGVINPVSAAREEFIIGWLYFTAIPLML